MVVIERRRRSCCQLESLIEKTLSKRRGYTQSIYKTSWETIWENDGKECGNCKKDILTVFHFKTKKFFEYNITDKKILFFGKITQSTVSNLNTVCNVLKLEGEFRNSYGMVGHDLVYIKDGKFYDGEMNEIHDNLDEKLHVYRSGQSKERYNRIKSMMDVGVVGLEDICGYKVWIERIDGKWCAISDLEPSIRFPISAKEAFSAVSTRYTGRIISSGNSDIYKSKYDDYITEKVDSGSLDEWEIGMKNYSKYKFRIVKDISKNRELSDRELSGEWDEKWILESEGDITFDKRIMDRSQVKDFIRYALDINSVYADNKQRHHFPDIVRNTPINVIITGDSISKHRFVAKTLDIINTVGREIRVTKLCDADKDKYNRVADPEFLAVSVYGKECDVYGYDIDALIRHGFVYYIIQRFEEGLIKERAPERVKIIKGILPNLVERKRYPVVLNENDKEIVICNNDGEFHISLIDGSLAKIVGDDRVYICVGLRIDCIVDIKPFIIHDGIRYETDFIMNEIFSKMMMIIDEKYPDEGTMRQIKYKNR